jgi:hypothetical protein
MIGYRKAFMKNILIIISLISVFIMGCSTPGSTETKAAANSLRKENRRIASADMRTEQSDQLKKIVGKYVRDSDKLTVEFHGRAGGYGQTGYLKVYLTSDQNYTWVTDDIDFPPIGIATNGPTVSVIALSTLSYGIFSGKANELRLIRLESSDNFESISVQDSTPSFSVVGLEATDPSVLKSFQQGAKFDGPVSLNFDAANSTVFAAFHRAEY